MKSQVRILSGIAFLGLLLWGCSKNDSSTDNLSLKQAINQGAENVNKAVDAIAATKAYSIFTINDITSKSESVADPTYKVSIPLTSISGVYEYKPVPKSDKWGFSLIQFFDRTADNSNMIVKLPLTKVEHPRSLRNYSPEDPALTNNFSISVSDYHNNYNSYWDFDYILASEIAVDNVVTGNLDIKSVKSPVDGTHYASKFAFTGSYTAKYSYESGDPTVSSFAITENDKVLYEEQLKTIKNDDARFGREREYILTIGDVQITRNSETRKTEVSVNGVLQPNATVTVIDKEDDEEASVCKKRDIQITFEDGTTATVSALIGKSVDNIKTVYTSLHSVYFAAYIVDWIAYDIYYHRN
jgi:hypothetical protein